MLKRNKRIQGRSNLEMILENGDRKKTPFFIFVRQSNKQSMHRYAVILGKKLDKSAVHRNKKRRQIYEIIHHLEKESKMPSSSHFDIVFLGRLGVMELNFDELKENIAPLLKPLL